ncbi:phytanoyl-CoA dioxygenase family protein [Pseudomonas caricapapayae]|uniref:phytanoyl-CoA dioxygenase family protein n=1 Tax=Pseudomonas caricapapayae TaxID=46678 RepID=UPI0006D60E0D|nr:phytanoyl-CoA dioxygenase family protein [Pseudomonas caricapapayae]KAA8694272.1 phytanoyl-CoA dioxygenase family protein [Pseudomonas caricapapayae]
MFSLTGVQKKQFKEDGFIICDEIINQEDVELLLNRFEVIFDGEYETGLDPDEVNWKKNRDSESLTRQICNGWKSDRYVASVILRSEIGRACAYLGDWPGARLTQDNLLWKPPGGRPIGFHQDSSYEEFIVPNEWVSCWIALDNTSSLGGTVEYVKGSHLWEKTGKIRQFHGPKDPHENLRRAASRAGLEDFDTVKIEVPAGGGTFHSGWIWHGSDVNKRDIPRRSIVAHCMSSEARFHPNPVTTNRTYSRFKRFGDQHMDETHFPILWREDGYASPFIAPYSARQLGWAEG